MGLIKVMPGCLVCMLSSYYNGKFINQKVNDIDALNTLIKDNIYMQERIIEENITRKNGKAVRYELGSVLLYNQEYLLTAFSRFDDQNKA